MTAALPVSALDVSIQAQVLNLPAELQHEFDLTYLLIAHDLSVVEHLSDRVLVMYLSRIVESADADAIYQQPRHPYTEALLAAIPVADPRSRRRRAGLKGTPPDPSAPPPGCSFHTRRRYVEPRCRDAAPEPASLRTANGSPHQVSCHVADQLHLQAYQE